MSLNYRDIAPALGRYVWDAKPGLIPCSDAAGEVAAVGDGVADLRPGDRVISVFNPRWFGGRPPLTLGNDGYGTGVDGWLAQYKVVSQEALVRLPDAVPFEAGATLPCAATTAWTALSGAAPVRAGDTVLTLGTGGVSIFAVQLAKLVGATVVSTTSSATKAARLQALGADEVVNYRETPEFGRYVKQVLTGGVGVDRVVEVGGPATINESLRAVRWGGEVVLIDFLSSDNPGIDYFHLKGSGATTRAIGVGDRAAAADLVRAWAASGLEPVIDRTFAFADVRDAFAHSKDARQVGKIVVTLDA